MIWNIVKKKNISQRDREMLLDLEDKLSKKFNSDLEQIKYTDTMENQAIRDYCEALGLLRAIITLKDISTNEEKKESSCGLMKKMRETTKEHTKYWLEFLKSIE
jgi:hypothetical protein